MTDSNVATSAVETTINSALLLSGNNTINVGQATGLFTAAASTIYIGDGTTTATSEECPLQTQLGGVLISAGILDATGNCLLIEAGSKVTIERGTIKTDSASVLGTLTLNNKGSDGAVNLSFSEQFLVCAGGSLFVVAEESAATTLLGTTDAAQLTVAGNATASFLAGGDQSCTVTVVGNVLVADGYFTATSGSRFGKNRHSGFN